jgi:hypothetical protein
MVSGVRRATAFLILVGGLMLGTAPGDAAGPLEKNFYLSGPRYDAQLPPCDHPGALARIASTFAEKEGKFWNSDLQIREIDRVREVAVRPWAVDTIPRRFCTGMATVSDGKKRRVNFSIIEDGGPISVTWGVEWCVVGLDRNWSYNPACRMALP